MVEVVIKKVQLDDINQLQKIGRQTFYATFSDKNTEENMSAYLRDGFSLEKISAELLNNESDFYFAIYQNDVVGYLKINWGKTQTVPQNKSAVEIERIYVLPEFQGKDVGKQLYNKALEIAQQKNAEFMWLGVWEENPRAISFYKKNGFVEFDKHIFKLGDDEQTDIMMKLALK